MVTGSQTADSVASISIPPNNSSYASNDSAPSICFILVLTYCAYQALRSYFRTRCRELASEATQRVVLVQAVGKEQGACCYGFVLGLGASYTLLL